MLSEKHAFEVLNECIVVLEAQSRPFSDIET